MELKIGEIQPGIIQEQGAVKEQPTQEDFTFTLNKLSENGLDQRVNKLVNEISEQGKRIASHMDIKDMKHYRALVTQFINEVVTNSHRFKRNNILDRRGRHRVYGMVQLIDKKLDELANSLLEGEKDHIGILAKIDEIRGMLLDILM